MMTLIFFSSSVRTPYLPYLFFFFNDTATTEIYTLSLHDALPISRDLGRKTRPDIKLGICGEHGGEPNSVKFCHRLGLEYVSCSPFRIPIARLAAAQAALES